MGGTDIGGFSTPDSNAPVQQYGPISPAGPAAPASGTASTIKKSELEAAEILMGAQFPGLTPPNLEGASNTAVMQISMMVDRTKNDIISSMWDTFQKGVDEIAEHAKKDELKHWREKVFQNGPKSATEYYAYLLTLTATSRADELSSTGNSGPSALSVQFNSAFNQWLAIPSNNLSVDPSLRGNYPDPSFIVGSLASSQDIVRQAIGASGIVSVSPLADALTAVGPTSGLPADYQAAAALVAALLNGGATYKATIDAIEESARSGKPPQDMEFALNYAQNILAIVSHNVEGDNQTNPNQRGQNNMIRLMLSMMALNLVYRTGYGGMEGGKEFTDLLKEGGTSDLDPAIKPTIDKLIAQIQNFLPTDESERATVIASLSEYIDSKDSVNSMLSTTRMFAASLGEKPDLLQKRLEVNNS